MLYYSKSFLLFCCYRAIVITIGASFAGRVALSTNNVRGGTWTSMKPHGLCNSSPDGVHYLLEFFGCAKEQLDSLPFMRKLLSKAISDSGITVLNKHFYRFSPHGITGYLLLSASHISIHTWPEYSYLTCDVFSCGGEDEAKGIVKYIRANILHEKMSKRKLKRGFRVHSKS